MVIMAILSLINYITALFLLAGFQSLPVVPGSDCDSGARVRKWISSENMIWKELDVKKICCMEWAQTILKLQVGETFSCTIMMGSVAVFF